MSIGYRLATIAFGLAVSFGALAQQQPPEQPIEPPATQDQPTEQPAIEASPTAPEITPTVPTSPEHDEATAKDRAKDASQNDHLIFGDGWAQWVMAGTGILAMFLSAWAVWLLKRTLEATRDAVKAADDAVDVTREIGEAQIRAYLGISSIKIRERDKIMQDRFPGDASFWIDITVENSGQSPARDVELSFSVSQRKRGDPAPIGKAHYNKRHFIVGANSVHIEPIGVRFKFSKTKRLYLFRDSENAGGPHEDSFVDGRLEYTDCFSRRRFYEWSFGFDGDFLAGGYEGRIAWYRGKDIKLLDYQYATDERLVPA